MMGRVWKGVLASPKRHTTTSGPSPFQGKEMALLFNGQPAELCWWCHRPFVISHWMDRLCPSCLDRDRREQFQESAADPPEPQVTCCVPETTAQETDQ